MEKNNEKAVAENEVLMSYVQDLEDVVDVLIGVESTDPSTWDEAILRAIRKANNIKHYFLMGLD